MATKKTKKRTKAERSKELSKIKKLLKKEEYRQQAIQLLVTLDDPEHWKAISAMIEIPVDKHGFAEVGNANMNLLAHLPDDVEGVDTKKQQARDLRLQAGSLLIAKAVPHVHRLSITGRSGMPWPHLDQLAKLERLRDLELRYLSLVGAGDVLEGLTALTKLSISRADITRIPEMPNVEELHLEQLGDVAVGSMPKLRTLRISNSSALVDWTGMGASSALEHVTVISDSNITDLDAIGVAVKRGAPLREMLLNTCPALESIVGLEGADQLETFQVRDATKLQDIRALGSATKLRTLTLRGCGVGDVSMLKDLEHLEVLDLTGCVNVKGIEALQNHASLRVVALGGTPCTREEVGALIRWSTWAPTPLIRSLAARVRGFIN